jgi:hypothetical protein
LCHEQGAAAAGICKQSSFCIIKLLSTIDEFQKVFVHRSARDLQKKWKTHVKDQLYLGGGKLFAFISRLDKKFLTVNWETHGNGASNPNDFLTQQKDAWAEFWSPEDPHLIHQVSQNYRDLRKAVLEQDSYTVFDEDRLDKSLRGYKKDTLGGDFWKPSELRFLPPPAKRSISNACEFAINAVAMPHQIIISLNALLGKPGNGCRTVCKTPVLYRMILRADESVRTWELENAQSYDTAKVGSSALLAALKRNLKAEVAKWLGQEFASIFNAYEKCFDTLDLNVLMEEAIYSGFPLDQLAFSLQQHMAPRVLQSNGVSSQPIIINRSILAGCKNSVPFTRAYSQRDMMNLTKEHPEGNTQVYVDDTSMHAVGECSQDMSRCYRLSPASHEVFQASSSQIEAQTFP